ncbi:MAG: flagellar basal body L-ring protein FlgH [Pseudomonadota bacterium]
MTRLKLCAALAATTLLTAGCAPRPPLMDSYEPPPPVVITVAEGEPGAVYRSGLDLRLFEDVRARRVGDILTVRLSEATSASKSSSTSISKDSAADYQNPTVFGRPITMDGIPLLSSSLSGSQTFDGEGDSAQSNSLTGDITVTVVERFPNGNLRIRGEKWVTINQGREFIRLSGIVRSIDIADDNSISSTQIADARIAYSGRGVLDAANRMGFVQRFLSSILHPF